MLTNHFYSLVTCGKCYNYKIALQPLFLLAVLIPTILVKSIINADPAFVKPIFGEVFTAKPVKMDLLSSLYKTLWPYTQQFIQRKQEVHLI